MTNVCYVVSLTCHVVLVTLHLKGPNGKRPPNGPGNSDNGRQVAFALISFWNPREGFKSFYCIMSAVLQLRAILYVATEYIQVSINSQTAFPSLSSAPKRRDLTKDNQKLATTTFVDSAGRSRSFGTKRALGIVAQFGQDAKRVSHYLR